MENVKTANAAENITTEELLFQIVINVHKNVAAMLTASENYKHVAGFVPMPSGAVVGQYIKVTEVDADGKVRATQTVDIDTIIKTLRNTLFSLDA